MDHSVISWIDLLIIGLYLAVMLGVGVWFVRRIKGEDDFYVAGRSLGPVVIMATVCATIIGGSAMMGRASKAYSQGFECVMTALPYLIGMYIFSGIAGRIHLVGKHYGVTSIPDLFRIRFGKLPQILLSILIALAMMGTVSAQISATATIFNMVGGGVGISFETAALIATIIFIIYTAASGLFGVVYTDVVQFFMLLIFVYILIPVRSLSVAGGFSGFLKHLDPDYIKPTFNGRILGDIVTYLVFTLAGAEMWQRAFAAKDKKTAKRGTFLGTAIYMVTIGLIFFMGLVGRQLLPDVVAKYGSTDAVVPALAIEILPIGLTGLALAGMLSVMMSTADSYLLVAVQTCIHDVGKTIKPDMSEKRELVLSRIFTVILAFGALLLALYVKSVYSILTGTWAYYAAAAGFPALAALYWKKATSAGMVSAIIGGFAVTAIWNAIPKIFGLEGNFLGLGATVPGAIASGLLLVIVSLATYKKHPSKVLSFEE